MPLEGERWCEYLSKQRKLRELQQTAVIRIESCCREIACWSGGRVALLVRGAGMCDRQSELDSWFCDSPPHGYVSEHMPVKGSWYA